MHFDYVKHEKKLEMRFKCMYTAKHEITEEDLE